MSVKYYMKFSWNLKNTATGTFFGSQKFHEIKIYIPILYHFFTTKIELN